MLILLINSGIIDDGNNVESTAVSFFQIKLYLSMLSSSFGMARFLQLGPCQLIPQNKMGIGMFLITIANFFGLLWKIFSITGALSVYIYFKNPSTGPTHLFFELVWRSCCLLFLPSLILVTFKTFIIKYIKSLAKDI